MHDHKLSLYDLTRSHWCFSFCLLFGKVSDEMAARLQLYLVTAVVPELCLSEIAQRGGKMRHILSKHTPASNISPATSIIAAVAVVALCLFSARAPGPGLRKVTYRCLLCMQTLYANFTTSGAAHRLLGPSKYLPMSIQRTPHWLGICHNGGPHLQYLFQFELEHGTVSTTACSHPRHPCRVVVHTMRGVTWQCLGEADAGDVCRVANVSAAGSVAHNGGVVEQAHQPPVISSRQKPSRRISAYSVDVCCICTSVPVDTRPISPIGEFSVAHLIPQRAEREAVQCASPFSSSMRMI